MWARIGSSNEVLEIYRTNKAITVDGVQHPRNIFTLWSQAELNAIGIYPIQDNGHPDSRFHTWGSATYTFDAGTNHVVASYTSKDKSLTDTLWTEQDKIDGNIPTDKSVGDVARFGLTNAQITASKAIAGSNLSLTDWYVTRKSERDIAIPTKVATYRAAVLSSLDTIETKIAAASDMAGFKALYQNELYANGSVKATAVINDWPEAID